MINDLIGLAAVLHGDNLIASSIGALGLVLFLEQFVQIHREGVVVLVRKGQRFVRFVGQRHVILLHFSASGVLALFNVHLQGSVHRAGGLVAGHGDVHSLFAGRSTDAFGQGVAAIVVLGFGVVSFQELGKIFAGHLKVGVFRVFGQGVGLAVAVFFHAAHGVAVERGAIDGVPL